jgi:hypothetical protein
VSPGGGPWILDRKIGGRVESAMTEPGEPVEVLSGTADGGLRWVVVTSGTDQDLYTMLNVYRDDQLLGGSGFGAPKLSPGSVMNEWRGQKDDLPGS